MSTPTLHAQVTQLWAARHQAFDDLAAANRRGLTAADTDVFTARCRDFDAGQAAVIAGLGAKGRGIVLLFADDDDDKVTGMSGKGRFRVISKGAGQ